MVNYENYFNAAPVLEEPTVSTSTQEFKPSAKKGKNGVYKAIVRFLPSLSETHSAAIRKFVCYLENPLTRAKKTVDCPSTVGDEDIIQNTFFALRNSSNPILQANSKKFSRNEQYTSMIQVISCESQPELEGRILAWTYGIKVYKMIQDQQFPEVGQASNPFDILNTKVFSVKVYEKSGFNNYDECKFFDLDLAQSGLRITVTNAQGQNVTGVVTKDILATNEGKKKVFEYIQQNAPDMSRYEYHAWDADTTKFVQECIQIYSNPQQSMAAAASTGIISGQPTMSQRPMFQQGAQQPMVENVTMPTMSAMNPVQPAAAQPFQMPTMNPVQPAQPFQMPDMNATVGPQVDPRGFNAASELPFSVEGLMDTQKSQPAQVTAKPVSIDDILNGQML